MQIEIVVASITTAGAAASAVWVAYLQRVSESRRGHSGALMSLSEYCGRVRGAAAAALRDCSQALEQLQAGGSSERTARQRDHVFLEAQFEEGLRDEIRSDVAHFNGEIRKLRKDLLFAGGKIDESPRQTAADGGLRARELSDLQWRLTAYERSLDAADQQFRQSLVHYLERQVPYPPRRTVRKLRRRAEAGYRTRARDSEDTMSGMLRTASLGYPDPPDGAGPGGQGRAGRDGEPPPCGYCIWRCPHAPARPLV